MLTNTAIELAVAGLLVNFGVFITAAANWLNARTRMMEMGLQIADLQRQASHLAAVQGAAQALPAVPVAPTIITVPAAAQQAPPAPDAS